MAKTRIMILPSMVLLAVTLAPTAYSCSLIEGYFYQVTSLRGTVVGVSDHDFRHPIRWMRQQVVRDNVNLSVYAYRSRLNGLRNDRPIKSARADKDGAFYFGELPNGHYTLEVETPWGLDRYDVEITQLKQATKSVLIDVSPIYPNCKGGHEFIINTE